MKICMLPESADLGIGRVVDAYHKHLPKFGVQFVSEQDADLIICHAGVHAKQRQTDVLVCHGLYPTATLDKSDVYFDANADVIRNAREARAITVPSSWVAMPFKRDMAITPYIVPHGIDVREWHPSPVHDNYVLWAKGHKPGVCDYSVVNDLASAIPGMQFVTTFGKPSSNVRVTGVLPFSEMKKTLSKAAVYLATTKETFGIQTLEAMACGVPVVGYHHGATPEIVTHGVTGWLAKPGDIDGLVEGIRWAIDNQSEISYRAQARASQFTWDAACQRLVDVMKIVLGVEQNIPLVSVIIPCYNYGKWVGSAIESVLNQTYTGAKEVIVVNDGSNDNTDEAVRPYLDRVSYFKKPNGGVAEARNFGIRHSSGDLVACLDADDRWHPEFLDKLVPPMKADRSLGLAYGLLQSDNGQGTHVSGWPPDFDFVEQATRHNRVPSSCVFRRSAWERAGGYRAQYTPAEDAELWLRIAAVGFNVRKVTNDVVYTYRLHSHSLSRTVREPDWVMDKPYHANMNWAPFAAPAVGKSSHMFRDYDDPWISVVVPVGPGHENLVYRVLDSLQSQTVMNWEAIVVNDSGNALVQPSTGRPLSQAYPFIIEVNSGRSGVAKARNLGAKQAHANMLMFVDADDWLLPGCFSHVVQAYNENPCSYIYTDWLGFDGEKTSSHLSKEFTVNGILKEALHPITALVPKAWHDEIGGFDESIAGWEDWVYYLDLVKAGHCGMRVPVQGLMYDYSSGNRREDSLKLRNSLLPIIRKRYQEDKMGCSSCGGKRGGNGSSPNMVVPTQMRSTTMAKPVMATKEPVNDNKMVAVVENSGNIGSHGIVGARTRINYGRHKHGDVFQMHIDDAVAQPQRYVRVAGSMLREPIPDKPVAPVPEPVPEKPVVVPKEMIIEQPVVEQVEETLPKIVPVPDDEIEVDITILPLTQIKQLGLSAEDAKAALDLEQSSSKPRQSVIAYLKTIT